MANKKKESRKGEVLILGYHPEMRTIVDAGFDPRDPDLTPHPKAKHFRERAEFLPYEPPDPRPK